MQVEFIPTRRSLLSRLKDVNDDVSWREFFDTYSKLIYGTAVRSGLSDAEAQDVVQETVTSMARKIGEFQYDPARGSFKTRLLNLTRWRIIDQLRKRPPVASGASRPSDDTGTGTIERIPDRAEPWLKSYWDVEWEKEMLQTAMERAKQKVDPKQFQIFDLYVVRDWPVTRVAATLNINVAQVYLARHRVGRAIRKEVKALEQSTGERMTIRW